MTTTAATRNAPVAMTALLIVLGVAFAALGGLYLAKTAGQLPAFLPGHQAGSAHHHTKHALASFAVAIVCLAGAWFTTGKRQAPAA
ncbi:MAG: hypothetical protein ACM3ML_09590 [Micromonosporaceae bacterium]